MAAETDISGQVPAPEGPSSEWHPTRTTWILWMILGLPILYVGAVVYTLAALHGETQRSVSGTLDMGQLIVVVLLCFGLMWVHEGVHGIFMLAFGARPQFGMLRTGLLPYAFYATDPGHRFARRQYLAVSLAPLAILGLLGIPLCMLPFGGYLVVPFALHLAGCIGDIGISRHVLQGPPTVICEDLRDGVRFWKPAA
jgi:hypothetical protein